MQIGRKIYFEIATGNVLLDTGERSGSVKETTKEEDLARFSQLQGYASGDVDFIQLDYGERSNEFQSIGSMKIESDQIVIYPRLTIATDKTQIASDGIDTATITSDHAESFSVNDGEDYIATSLQFASEVPGTYTITAKSTLYGKNSLVVEVI